jgi:hypothetical protein
MWNIECFLGLGRAAPALSAAAAAFAAAALFLAGSSGQSAAVPMQGTPSRVAVVARNVTYPLHVTAPASEPDRLYVVQQNGIVRVLVRGRLQARPFLDLSGSVAAGGERGLLSIAFSPRLRPGWAALCRLRRRWLHRPAARSTRQFAEPRRASRQDRSPRRVFPRAPRQGGRVRPAKPMAVFVRPDDG